MKKRRLGSYEVAPIGLGVMNLSHAYGVPATKEQGHALLARALELGVDHFDTAAFYGNGKNEELAGPFLKPFRNRIRLISKGGMAMIDGKRTVDSRPESLKRDCDNSLRRLQTDHIDLYYVHRWNRDVPIEEVVGGMADLKRAGKIGEIGLSEISAETLRKAHKEAYVAAVQNEYSLWTRNPEIALSQACAELDTALVAFSPVARGFLSDQDLDPKSFAPGDLRITMPRFMEPNFAKNCALLAEYRAYARKIGTTSARLALAWLLHKGEHILPIPGTVSLRHLEENVGAQDIVLTPKQMVEIDQLIAGGKVHGARYTQAAQLDIDTEQFPDE